MNLYAIEFDYQGRRMGVDIHADSWDEAERMLWMLQAKGEVIGEIVASVPFAVPGFLARLWDWLAWKGAG